MGKPAPEYTIPYHEDKMRVKNYNVVSLLGSTVILRMTQERAHSLLRSSN
jgi:hypothetical protein